MSGQGSGLKSGYQNHQSQKPLRQLRPLRPSNQAGVPDPAAASTATEPLKDLQGINHEFFETNGSKNQGLAREHPRWPDILVVNLFVLRELLGLELIDFPDLIRSHDEFRNVQLRKRQMNSSKSPLGYHFLTRKDAMVLALAVSRDPTSTGPCNECRGDAHEPSVPLFLECRSVPNINGRACGNCELHNHRRQCSFYNGLAAPQVVFLSKAPAPFTPREDDFIALLRTCTQDTAGRIKKKYFPNRSVSCIAARIYQLSEEKRIPAFKTAL